MRRWRVLSPRWLLPLLGILILLVAPARSVAAHPLGNFTINLYSRLEVGAERIDIVYVVDTAEIPTYQEFGGEALNPDEHQDYLRQKAEELRTGLRLTVDGSAPDLQIARRELTFPEGQGGLRTTRIELGLAAALPRLATGQQRDLAYEDTNYAGRLGWHEVVVQPAPGVSLARSDAPAEDQSDELRSYPEDMLLSLPDVRTAAAVVEIGGAQVAPGQTIREAAGAQTTDRFAALIATEQLSLSVRLIALLVALGLVLHPG